MASRIAWSSPPEDEWTSEELLNQFTKAVQLSGTCPEELQRAKEEANETSDNDEDDDHNSDLHDKENPKKSEPYKNKYSARLMLLEIKTFLVKQLDEMSVDQISKGLDKHVLQRLQAVHYQLGAIAVAVEESSTGELHFNTIIEKLKDDAMNPRCINLLVAAYNQLGLIWGERYEHERAKTELLNACKIYKQYKEKHKNLAPISINDLFLKVKVENISNQNSQNGSIVTVADEQEPNFDDHMGSWDDLEQYHTYTLYYLAQICGHLGETDDAARYCHSTLHRQLADAHVFEPLEWSKNAAILSQFYSKQSNYKLARYLLSAAWAVLTTNSPTNDSSKAWTERYNTAKAEVGSTIGKFCVKVLQDSEAALDNPPPGGEPADSDEAAETREEKKLFQGLDEETLNDIQQRLPSGLVRDYEGARAVFLAGLEFLEKVTSFYTLEDYASLHTEAVQSISRLYQGLAVFEPHPDRQSKMHKRRVDMLTHLLNELNPQYYLQVCRQLRYELAETYSKMAACKEPSSAAGQASLTPSQWAKITSLNLESISSFKLFLKSFEDSSGNAPSRYPEEAERAAVVALFYMGRLWNKMKVTSRPQAIQNINNAIDCFKQVLEYVERNPECRDKLTDELELCEELVQLLPHKLAQLQ